MNLNVIASILQAVFCVMIALGLTVVVATSSGNKAAGVGVGLFALGLLGVLYAVAMERR